MGKARFIVNPTIHYSCMMPMLLSILILFVDNTKATGDGFPAPPTPHDLKFDHSGCLKSLQRSAYPCYQQHTKPLDQLVAFNTGAEQFDYTLEVCLCEHWWPENKPAQLSITRAPIVHCPTVTESESCTSFDESDSCMVKLWMGRTTHLDALKEDKFKTEAILKCTADSTSSTRSDPTYPIWVYKIGSLDIGRRCDKDKLMQQLNNLMEKYRKGSQFFWQIRIASGFINDCHCCDSSLIQEGTALVVFYKCWPTLDDLPGVGQEPQSRGDPDDIPKLADPSHNCYNLYGEPWAALLLKQNSLVQKWSPPSPENKMCVCEEDGILTPSSSCEEYVQKRSDQAASCVEKDTSDFNSHCITQNQNMRFAFALDQTTNTKVSIRCVDNGGAVYWPLYKPVVKHAYIWNDARVFVDIWDDGPIPAQQQLMICYNSQTATQHLTWKDSEWEAEEGSEWEARIEQDAAAMSSIWASRLNQKIENKRPNTDIHLQLAFDYNAFIQSWCPVLLNNEEARKKLFGNWELKYFHFFIEFTCEAVEPMDVNPH